MFLDLAQGNTIAFAIAQQYRLVRLQGETNTLLQTRVQRYRIPDRRSVQQVVAAVQADPRVSQAQPNFLYRHQKGSKKGPRGKSGKTTAALQYSADKIRLTPAHTIATGKRSLIAIIDSGIDRTHPEIAGAIVRWFNAVGDRTTRAHAHGTAIAGIIGARSELKGIAPAASLLAIRAFAPERGGTAVATTYVLLRAVDWAHKNRARLFNLSFAGPHDPAVERILQAAHDKGAILVAAAGNRGPRAPPAYPAAYRHVIAITATDSRDRIYRQANRGPYVDMAAPGVDVLVPVLEQGYDFRSGTSFAAAHVTGLIALMLERKPNLTTEDARTYLANSAVDLGPAGQDTQFGAGRADALQALRVTISDGRVDAQPAAAASSIPRR